MIENKIILFDFDGIYKTQDFYRGQNCRWINTKKLIGTNSYCDIYAQKNLHKKLENIGEHNLSFIGSGNYHYMSLFLTEKIKQSYCLVLFDNHSDMQKPVFEELLSCGGWVRTAIKHQHNLKRVILIGTCNHSLHIADKSLQNKVITFPYNEIEDKTNWYTELSTKIHYPVYISVDKDVFPEKIAKTNWDQGNLGKKDFIMALKSIAKTQKVVGMDVCGEFPLLSNEPFEFYKANQINNFANQKILELAEKIIA